jgi:large subunit ribosomal protein L23
MSIAARHYDTILRPVITEKSTLLSEQGKVVFEVPLKATKKDVADAVAALFKVEVISVNTVTTKGKTKRFRGVLGKRNDTKKAIVTLKDGQSIDVATGI